VSLTLSDSSLSHNGSEGLWFTNYATAITGTLTGNTFAHNNQEGMEIYANASMTGTIESNLISENGLDGMVIRPGNTVVTPIISSNTFISNTWNAIHLVYDNGSGLPVASGNVVYGNGRLNGVAVAGSLAYSTSWPANYSLPLGIDANLIINSGTELTVEPGAEILSGYSGRLVVHGALRAIGTPSQPITLTSYSPWWNGINYAQQSDDSRNRLEHVKLLNAGITIYDASPAFHAITVRGSQSYGLQAQSTSLLITGSTFESNGASGVSMNDSDLTMSNSTLRQNNGDGLELTVSGQVLAPALTSNTFISNTGYGILVRYSDGGGLPAVSGNLMSGNDDGDVVALRGTLAYSVTWPASYEHGLFVDGNLTVESGAELTVEPGLEIQFEDRMGLFIHGALRAIGTPTQPITFTNGSPPWGGWAGVFFDDDSDDTRSRLEHVTIHYAGYNSYWHNAIGTGIGVYDASPTIRNTTVRNSDGAGFWARNTAITLTQNLFAENDYDGIYLWNAELNLTASSVISNFGYAIRVRDMTAAGLPVVSGNSISGNTDLDGVGVEGNLSYSTTWPSSYNLPLVVADDLLVESGVDLTLDPGTVMLFDYDAGLFVNGQLHAVGTSVAPISFTSAETPPGIGDWDGIFLDGGDGLTRLAYCDISYAGNRVWWEGRYWYASLALLANDAEIFHCTIRQSGWSGMETFDSAPLFNHNVIRNNYRGVVVDGTTVFELRNSQIFSNTQAGLQNKTGLVQDARYNWWGDATGPYHPLLNPTGLGDQVSDDVLFDPWLDIPPTHLEIALNRTETDSTLLIYNSEDGTYTRQLLDGTRVSFDANGLHQYTLDPAGNQTAYTYHADESLAKMAFTPAGATAPSHIWSFVYAGGKLASIVDPAGEVTLFDVDEHGHLVEVTDGDAKTRRFYYDDDGLMTQQQDEAGQITSFSYDEYGAIRSETLPQRNIVDAVTGQPVLYQEVRSHTPSNTAYPLINDSPVGDPDAPAPPVPLAADLIDRVSSASGMESGHTNRWGSWTDRTDSLGRTTTYTHDDKNNLTRVTFPDGSCTQYGYDVVGNMLSKTVMEPASCALPLASVGPAAGFSWSYTYESRFNHVKTATDPRGNSTTYVYDYEEGAGEAGNPIRIEYPAVEDENGTTASPVEHFTYNSWSLLETETDPAGVVTRYIYTQGTPDEAYGQPGALFADGVTPVSGLLTQLIRDEGGLHVTSIYKEFNAHGYPLTSLGPRGSSPLACTSCATTAGEDLADQGSITHYSYDVRGRLLTEENGLGIVTKYEYAQWDELVRKTEDYTPDGITGRNIVTTYSYDPMGRLLSERIVADGIVHETLIAYDAAGNPISKRDGNGHTVTYSYDANRQLIGETDPLGFTTSYSYTMAGELTHITLPDGVTHRVRYDGYGHLLQETVDEGGLNLVTSYTYDANGNLLTETDPAGIVTCYTYDALNRMTSMRRDCGGLDLTLTYAYDVAGNLARLIDERGIETVNSYDALGRLTSVRHDAGGLDLETTYDVDPAGNLIRVTDERGLVTEFEYDALNRQISMTQDPTGLNLTTLTTYDRLGNQDSMHAPNGVVTFWETNAFGRPVRIVEDVGGRSAETITTYDNNLNLLTITDANGYSTHYSYDERDLQTQIRYADGTTVDHGYYPDGMLAWRINQAGDRVDFFYNGANQLEHKTYPGGATQTLAYNLAGHPTNLGQTMNGHTTAFSLAYNPVGHVVSSTQSLDGLSWTTSYTKAYASGTATTTYPSGVTVSVTEDAFGRPAQIGRDGYAVATYAYDDISGTISLTYTNGLVTRIESDSLGRVTRVEAAPLSDYRYGYDAAGNRSFIQRWHESGNPADVYVYDSLAQLTDVWCMGPTLPIQLGSSITTGCPNSPMTTATIDWWWEMMVTPWTIFPMMALD
jgi:YD repeat-containing protein